MLTLVNQHTDETIAEHVEVAVSRKTRRKGLLGRTVFAPASAMVLAPCAAIHTMFMRFAIDVIFVDEDGRALRIVQALRPWRIAVAPFAHAVIELPANVVRGYRVSVGDRLYLRDADGRRMRLFADEIREQAC